MAAAKLIRYESFRFFCLMATDKVIKAEKLYIVSLAKISWSIYSVFFEWKNIKDNEYFKFLKEVSMPQRIA